MAGQSLVVPLQSAVKREQFLLDLSRGRIDLLKVKMQNRGRQVWCLCGSIWAVHLTGTRMAKRFPYRTCTSIARDTGDKWAVAVPSDRFTSNDRCLAHVGEFMRFCNITQPPHIERGLFT